MFVVILIVAALGIGAGADHVAEKGLNISIPPIVVSK